MAVMPFTISFAKIFSVPSIISRRLAVALIKEKPRKWPWSANAEKNSVIR